MVRIEVGYDDQTGAVFSSFTCLATVPGYGDLRHEFVFNIVRATHAESDYFMDGSETRSTIVDPVHRAYIMNTVCSATNALLDEVRPQEVEMMTYTPNLPERALLKYNRIRRVLDENGYPLETVVNVHGRYIWVFRKP